ncbi:MAG: hypothetical protein K2W96_28935, partial [Gemmataceae bacterium]|nr:hypothetical protein [Gemmataceae bacterium]
GREASSLMASFYRHRLTCDATEALARAQREALGGDPIHWAAFVLFGDPEALRPGLPGWLARWRQRWHAGRFPS